MTIWVLDSNVWISGLLKPQSSLAKLVRYALSHVELAFSDATYAELVEVIERKCLAGKISAGDRLRFFLQVQQSAEFFDVPPIPPTCPDPDDDKFLALALACQAEYLITGDKALLGLAKCGKTAIVSPSGLYERLGA